MSADARDALRMSHVRLQQRCHDAEAHVERLMTENQRLRAALERIAATDGDEWFARSVARSALDVGE